MKALASDVVARPGVLVIAHRGASADAPENTLHAFRRALDARADLVELDYHHTQNGEPYVFHDKTLERTTDAVTRWGRKRLAIADHTDHDLRELDAGAWFDPRFRGARIPHLGMALDVIQEGALTLIERKAGDAPTLLRLLARRGCSERVVVQSFDWRFLAACRAENPRLVLAALGSKALTPERLEQIEQTGAAVVGWNHKHVDAQVVEAVHGRGWKLWVYTVDAAQRAQALAALGVDGIITNRPAEIRAALAADGHTQR